MSPLRLTVGFDFLFHIVISLARPPTLFPHQFPYVLFLQEYIFFSLAPSPL